jgi:hypothetical protein
VPKHGGNIAFLYSSLAKAVADGMSEAMEVHTGSNDTKPLAPSFVESIAKPRAKLAMAGRLSRQTRICDLFDHGGEPLQARS